MPSFEDDNLINIITDYGATPHWVGQYDNDGAKIQRALNDAADPTHKHYGKTVFIPFGNFHASKTISVPVGSRVLGAGKQSRIEMRHKSGLWAVGQPLIVSEDADAPPGSKYGVVLVDFHLNTHTRGQAFDLRTNKMLVKHLITTDDGFNPLSFKPLAPKAVLSGNAGGHLYGLTPGVLNLDPTGPADWGATYSLLQVKGTSNPLHFYQLCIAHQAGNFQLLVDDSADVNMHAFKYESVGIGVPTATDEDKTKILGGSLASVRNSVGITMFGGSGNFALNHPNISRTILDFRNTSHIELWQMVRRAEGGHEIKDGNWLHIVGTDGKTIDSLSKDYNIVYFNDQKSAIVPDTTTVVPSTASTTLSDTITVVTSTAPTTPKQDASPSCNQSVVEIKSTTTSDAYVEMFTKKGGHLKNFGSTKGLFLQNEGRCLKSDLFFC